MAQKVYIYIENGIYNVLYILIYKIGSHGHSKQTNHEILFRLVNILNSLY